MTTTSTDPRLGGAATPPSARAQFGDETSGSGKFRRQGNWFTERISADGSTGHPAVPGRYHLYVSLACPWAHRQLIVRELKGLQDAIGVTVVDPIRDERGWRFFAEPDADVPEAGPDPINGYRFLREAYVASDPAFEGRVTVPAIWDRVAGRIITNDFPVIDEQLNREFDDHARHPEVDLYPDDLRAEVDALDEAIYRDVNNGVYACGFAASQEAYDVAFVALFARLDELDRRLADRRYLAGDRLTLADVRLFTTLVRFDEVYHTHFKCNRRQLAQYEHLWPYARDLFQTPGFGTTVNWDHIKRHYYCTHDRLNPMALVPGGPSYDWAEPHGRA